MKKLLSLSLAIVMMLSCILGQAVLVNAADAVDYTDAPYAGVYAVSADAATTVTTEIGSVAELAAGETGYVYLLKGANVLTNSANANLTFTGLAGNGLDYLAQVTVDLPLAPSSISELTLSGNYSNPQAPYTDYGAAGVAFGPNGSVDVTLTAPAAGLYVTQIQFATDAQAQMTVESDTGFYGVINQQAGRVGWNELHQGTHGVGNQDMEIMFLRAGANTITFKNTGASATLISKIKLAKTGSLASLEAYNWQLNLENLKPVLVAGFEPEATPDPVPTAAPTTDITYTAELAGVYAVTADKDVTIMNETGSKAEITAGETKYIYLIAGVNNIETTDATANLTFTQLDNNGIAYINNIEVDNIPLADQREYADMANIIEGDGTYEVGADFVNIAPGAAIKVVVNMPVAGFVYPYLQVKDTVVNTFKISSDTGFYTEILKDTASWQTTCWVDGSAQQDMEFLYLRKGVNYITIKHTGSSNATLGTLRMSKTTDIPKWVDQAQLKNLKVIEARLSATGVTTGNNELAFYGKVGAQYLDRSYGIEVAGIKYFGAKDGDTVGNYNGSTTFTFGDWNGTFEIILTNLDGYMEAGETTYKFFVGSQYTNEATVVVE